MSDEQVEAVVWHALLKTPDSKDGKLLCREHLKDGQKNSVHLQVFGEVDGENFEYETRGILSVGKSRKQKPAAAPYKQVLEYVLGKLNSATRESILRDLPDEWEANDKEWDSDIGVQAEIKDMIDRLKEKMDEVKVNGSVTWKGVKI